jgi:hypothetical protein
MTSFKPKTSKNIKLNKKYSVTLDATHKEFLNEFSENEKTIIDHKSEIAKLKQKLKDVNVVLSVEKKLEMTDKIAELKDNIKEIKYKKNDYLLDNSKYIFEYFENKKNINNIDDSTKMVTSKNILLFNIFKIKKDDTPDNIVYSTENKNKNIVQKYLANIDETFLDMNSFIRTTDICQSCYKGELIPLDDEGVLICNLCAVNIPYLIENEKPSYKEPPKEVCFYAYKKINHFKEILSQFQGKETTQIPDEVIDHIQLQIKKERISIQHLTHHKTKEILKKLGFNKYYEHIAFIKNKMGIKPPVFSQELEDTLCNLFMEIQAPYAKTCPDYRVNFLNYYYVLFKLCELLEENAFLNDIPLLKDREKLIEQDETWKKMCVELNWEFIPTV